ncbi:hypothetical protein [Chryseolinea sp. H1M3-3]|uniref:hypothetical protein n=1 Tax=Chryseolinea sp. H1M3-3 TaxID=3034144 RepID=UPI0023EDF9B6|nr:hypothetical protein [Chryseolinea sp. H1M3-3]
MSRFYLFSFLIFTQLSAFAQEGKRERHRYLGEEQPGVTPAIFAKGIVSDENRYEFGSTFSSDGVEFFYAIEINKKPEIHYIKYENNVWTKSKKLLSHERYGYNDPFLSPDGKKLFFISDRALDGKGDKKDIDIWYIERTNTGWSDPINAGKAINTDKNEYYISFAKNGTMYFSSNGGTTMENDKNYNIRTSEFKGGKFLSSNPLNEAINTEYYEADVFISPNEKYIIYCSERPGGKGKGDLYISFKDDKGAWQPAKNMGASINTSGYEFCPFVTSDNKYLFFSRDGDIYWVSTKVVDNLR